ncbi:MAG: ABC transporter permease [Clostridium sp.]|nr:ABC transporter permease [Clostridium sp.]
MKTFLHNFKYTIKIIIHNRLQMMWSLVFIIALGTLFYAVFGDLYEKEEYLHSIKAAVVIDDESVKANFDTIAANVSLDGEEKLLDVVETSGMEEAETLLADEEIEGIFYSEQGELRLLVKDEGIEESILTSIVGRYHQAVTIAADLSKTAPEKIPGAMQVLFAGESKNTEKKLSGGNGDVYIQYFYNLIAMACLMSINAGVGFSVNNQANLSTVGARKCISGAASFVQTVSGLLATVVTQTICSLLGLLYLIILGVNFGSQAGYAGLVILCGCLTGTCLGFFIGSIGGLQKNTKELLGTAIVVGTAFLSGLMIADMRMTIEEKCPIINKINPSALIADSFYSLEIYDTYDRYFRNLITLLIISVICIIGGVLVGRRKKYASI